MTRGTRAAREHRKVYLRKTHPTLYHSVMTVAVASVALGFNFWYSNPAFNPFNIPKNLVGCAFFVLGTSQLVFLNWLRDLRKVRIVLAVSISWTFFWGLANTQQSFAGVASFQLPILYLAAAILQVPLLIEAPVNPMTEKASE